MQECPAGRGRPRRSNPFRSGRGPSPLFGSGFCRVGSERVWARLRRSAGRKSGRRVGMDVERDLASEVFCLDGSA